jgi:peptide methionine sulfoxide reductase MsrA
VPLKKFYKAEDYHQEYNDNNSIAPKLAKLEKKKVIQETSQATK